MNKTFDDVLKEIMALPKDKQDALKKALDAIKESGNADLIYGVLRIRLNDGEKK
jgi:hypothetical protein